jgi:hypothetical protein
MGDIFRSILCVEDKVHNVFSPLVDIDSPCSTTLIHHSAAWRRPGKVLLRKKMETNVFPPRVVTSRLMAMRSSIRRPGLELTRASETSFDGRMYFARQEQRAPLPRQSLAIGGIIGDNCDKIF